MHIARLVGAALIVAAPFAMVGDRDPARIRARSHAPRSQKIGSGCETTVPQFGFRGPERKQRQATVEVKPA